MSGRVPPGVIARLLAWCRVSGFYDLQKEVWNIVSDGYAVQQVLIQLQTLLLADAGITDLQKAAIFEVRKQQ